MLLLVFKDGQTKQSRTSRFQLLNASGNEYYKQKGPYAGVNLNFTIPDAGKLAFSIAYASLNTENSFIADGDGVEPGETIEFDDIKDTNTGDSSGYSYSLNWSMPLKGNFIFRSRIKVNQYKQDIFFDGTSFNNINESSTLLLVGVTNIF